MQSHRDDRFSGEVHPAKVDPHKEGIDLLMYSGAFLASPGKEKHLWIICVTRSAYLEFSIRLSVYSRLQWRNFIARFDSVVLPGETSDIYDAETKSQNSSRDTAD
jgi:hypothetical protein